MIAKGEKILRVMADGNKPFTAGAVWLKGDGGWRCVAAAPIIRWMVGLAPHRAVLMLKAKRLRYDWVPNGHGRISRVGEVD